MIFWDGLKSKRSGFLINISSLANWTLHLVTSILHELLNSVTSWIKLRYPFWSCSLGLCKNMQQLVLFDVLWYSLCSNLPEKKFGDKQINRNTNLIAPWYCPFKRFSTDASFFSAELSREGRQLRSHWIRLVLRALLNNRPFFVWRSVATLSIPSENEKHQSSVPHSFRKQNRLETF